MTLFGGVVVALVVALVVIAVLVVALRRAREDAAFALALVDAARADAMAAEARSRGVGGTGGHSAPVVTPIDTRRRGIAALVPARVERPRRRGR